MAENLITRWFHCNECGEASPHLLLANPDEWECLCCDLRTLPSWRVRRKAPDNEHQDSDQNTR